MSKSGKSKSSGLVIRDFSDSERSSGGDKAGQTIDDQDGRSKL